MADFLVSEIQHIIIVIILIILSSKFLEVLIEVHAPRKAVSSSFYVNIQTALFLLFCRTLAYVLLRATHIN